MEKLCQVDCLQVCNIDSTNMTPSHWLAIAQAVETHYETYDGFVICHGTDTLAYTAAALSYLIQDSPKPIVLTGSQKPIHMDITDSKTNLLDSFTVACDRAATRGDSGVRRGGDPWEPGPGRPIPRALAPSPASTTLSWGWCRRGVWCRTSCPRPAPAPRFSTP